MLETLPCRSNVCFLGDERTRCAGLVLCRALSPQRERLVLFGTVLIWPGIPVSSHQKKSDDDKVPVHCCNQSLRQHLLDDMAVRRFSPKTLSNYLRDVGRFGTLPGLLPLYGNSRGCAPVQDCAERGWHADIDHECHRVGAEIFLSPDTRLPRLCTQAGSGGAAPQHTHETQH